MTEYLFFVAPILIARLNRIELNQEQFRTMGVEDTGRSRREVAIRFEMLVQREAGDSAVLAWGSAFDFIEALLRTTGTLDFNTEHFEFIQGIL